MPTPPGPSPSAEELESVTLKKQGTATRKASLGVVGPSFSGSFLQPQPQLRWHLLFSVLSCFSRV